MGGVKIKLHKKDSIDEECENVNSGSELVI